MAIEDLQTAIEEERKRNVQPLFNVTNNREELRTIAQDTINYCAKIYGDLVRLTEKEWEIVPRTVICMMENYIRVLDSSKSADKSVSVKIGDFMTLYIESGMIENSEKSGTLNPMITLGPELMYYNDDPKKNELKMEQPVIPAEDISIFNSVCNNTQKDLKVNFRVMYEQAEVIGYIFLAFLRCVRNWLIQHKDDEEHGVDLFVGTVLDIGISRYLKEDDMNYDIVAGRRTHHDASECNYAIQYAGGQNFKVTAKDDDVTEERGRKDDANA